MGKRVMSFIEKHFYPIGTAVVLAWLCTITGAILASVIGFCTGLMITSFILKRFGG